MKLLINRIYTLLKEHPKLNVYIYGAGYDGTLIKNLFDIKGIIITSYIVDDGYKLQNSIQNIEVIEYSKLEVSFNNSIFVFAMNANPNKQASISKLKYAGLKYVFDFTRDEINNTLLENCYYFLEKYKIPINDTFLTIQTHDGYSVKLINPFKLEKNFQIAFAIEMVDLILPEIDNSFIFMNEGKYEWDNVIINKNDTVIDCGANIGIFSAIAAAKKANVYAFEPTPNIIIILNSLTNIYPNIQIKEYALSNKTESINLTISDINNTSNSILKSTNLAVNHLSNLNNFISVDAITLDDFVLKEKIKKVDFIKADIEGAERFLLQGATNVLKEFEPKISICTYHFHDDKQVLEDIIKQVNPKYTIKHNWKKLYAYVQ